MDGAFGLWAAASAKTKHLVKGIELADSLATDAHKWLNVPYDCGLVFVKKREALLSALSATAAYLPETSNRESISIRTGNVEGSTRHSCLGSFKIAG